MGCSSWQCHMTPLYWPRHPRLATRGTCKSPAYWKCRLRLRSGNACASIPRSDWSIAISAQVQCPCASICPSQCMPAEGNYALFHAQIEHILTLIAQVFQLEVVLVCLCSERRIFIRNAKGFGPGDFAVDWEFCSRGESISPCMYHYILRTGAHHGEPATIACHTRIADTGDASTPEVLVIEDTLHARQAPRHYQTHAEDLTEDQQRILGKLMQRQQVRECISTAGCAMGRRRAAWAVCSCASALECPSLAPPPTVWACWPSSTSSLAASRPNSVPSSPTCRVLPVPFVDQSLPERWCRSGCRGKAWRRRPDADWALRADPGPVSLCRMYEA